MKIYGATYRQMLDVLDELPNLTFNAYSQLRRDGTSWNITLRVKDSRGNFARRGRRGRRMISACWHAHKEFLIRLFHLAPTMRVVTMITTYNGLNDFSEKWRSTGTRNIGSIMEPLYLDEACACDRRIA